MNSSLGFPAKPNPFFMLTWSALHTHELKGILLYCRRNCCKSLSHCSGWVCLPFKCSWHRARLCVPLQVLLWTITSLIDIFLTTWRVWGFWIFWSAYNSSYLRPCARYTLSFYIHCSPIPVLSEWYLFHAAQGGQTKTCHQKLHPCHTRYNWTVRKQRLPYTKR